MDADVIVVGAGLAGLVAAHELTSRGRRVALVDQENAANLGGQAFWSFGGLFLVDSPEQRRLGIKDSFGLAWTDWQGSARFDRLADEDSWAVRWARAYVEWAAGEKRSWLAGHGIELLPTVGWAERGDLRADGHGNSVPRFHIAWGTGTGVVEPFVRSARQAARDGLLTFHHRHRVDELVVEGGTARGVRGTVLTPDDSPRGVASGRDRAGDFELTAQAVVLTTGGIGADHDIVRRYWPERLGTPRPHGHRRPGLRRRPHARHQRRGRRTARQPRPHVALHRGPAQLGPDLARPRHPHPARTVVHLARRPRPPAARPCLPGYDTLSTLKYLRTTEDIAGYDHSWFILTRKIIEKEFALSGSEQNPDITAKDRKAVLRDRLLGKGAPAPVRAFLDQGEDFVTADSLERLVEKMNGLTGERLLDAAEVRRQIEARDAQIANPYSKDAQVQGIRNARRYIGDRLGRVAAPHRLLDPAAGPLIGVRLHVLTRKTLGGIQTDLDSRALGTDGAPVEGLYAAGEVAGFGGGGVHGYNALEGTFLGGCLFSGRAAGRHAARHTG